MAVNRRLLKERLNLDPGLELKTKPRTNNHLKLFLKDSQRYVKRRNNSPSLAGALSCA
jgi:hypothetical protein